MSSESCWQSSDLVNSVKCFLHYYAKATGSLAPDCSAVTKFLLFLFLRFLLFVFFVLKFSLCLSKFLCSAICWCFWTKSSAMAPQNGGRPPIVLLF